MEEYSGVSIFFFIMLTVFVWFLVNHSPKERWGAKERQKLHYNRKTYHIYHRMRVDEVLIHPIFNILGKTKNHGDGVEKFNEVSQNTPSCSRIEASMVSFGPLWGRRNLTPLIWTIFLPHWIFKRAEDIGLDSSNSMYNLLNLN